LTGAGISTDSGIPDYRGPNGVWTRDPAAADLFTYTNFMSDPAVRARFWRTYLGHPAWDAQPNAAHRALTDLERNGSAFTSGAMRLMLARIPVGAVAPPGVAEWSKISLLGNIVRVIYLGVSRSWMY
jgi:hypothetical protein